LKKKNSKGKAVKQDVYTKLLLPKMLGYLADDLAAFSRSVRQRISERMSEPEGIRGLSELCLEECEAAAGTSNVLLGPQRL
jgi:hypothetical protein